jgi:hypothetical protein
VEFRTPFSVEPPPEPWGVQELWVGDRDADVDVGVEETRDDDVVDFDWTSIRDESVDDVGVV